MLLAESRSNMTAGREEARAKEEQKFLLEKESRAFMKKCCERVTWAMFHDLCALLIVRNAVLETSSDCIGNQLVDCEVDFWGCQQCTVECAGSCPGVHKCTEIYSCGGLREIYRKVVVSPPVECV